MARSTARLESGLDLLAETEGNGEAAAKGDRVIYNLRIFLNQGDEVPMNERQLASIPEDHPSYSVTVVEDRKLVNHCIVLGKRQAIAAVEKSLVGMRVGGFRKLRASAHLAYRNRGLPGMIPGNAVLTLEIWLRKINPEGSQRDGITVWE